MLYLGMTAVNNIGHKISRIRELREIKQEQLAELLGISQQAVSKMEQSDSVDDLMLARVAKALGVSPGLIKAFNEDNAIFNIQNNYDTATHNVNYQFNPIEKIVELYDALLKSEREKMELMERVIKKLEG
jgi:transcriptional regulator with XRE-family HTH domain